MKKFGVAFAVVLFVASIAFAQSEVASAEIQGIDTTLPHSRYVSGYMLDDSVGEAVITVLALDADGQPVEGAEVVWTVTNRGSNLGFVVGSSSDRPQSLVTVRGSQERTVDGGVTGPDGRAYLVVDSFRSGDIVVTVTVGGVPAETYSGGGMRVVWF